MVEFGPARDPEVGLAVWAEVRRLPLPLGNNAAGHPVVVSRNARDLGERSGESQTLTSPSRLSRSVERRPWCCAPLCRRRRLASDASGHPSKATGS